MSAIRRTAIACASASLGALCASMALAAPGWASPREDRYRLHRLRVLGGTGPQALLSLIASSSSDAPAPASYGGA